MPWIGSSALEWNEAEVPILPRKLRRAQMISFLEDLHPTTIGIEAGGAAHYWARTFATMGHEVRIMAPQFRGKASTAGGKVVKEPDLGNIGNLIAGALGGVGGGTILGLLLGAGGAAADGVDLSALAGQLVGGGVAGAVVQIIAGLIINKVLKR